MTSSGTPRHDARCDEICDIARRTLVDDGLERFVMRDIAGRAGMKLGNLQYYFPTRADLLEAIMRAEFDRDLAAISSVATQTSGDADLIAIARGLLDNWTAGGGGNIWQTLSLLAPHDPRFRDLSETIYSTFYTEIGHVIRASDHEVDEAEIAARAQLITSILDGVALQSLSAPTNRDDDLVARALTLVTAVADGSIGQPP